MHKTELLHAMLAAYDAEFVYRVPPESSDHSTSMAVKVDNPPIFTVLYRVGDELEIFIYREEQEQCNVMCDTMIEALQIIVRHLREADRITPIE